MYEKSSKCLVIRKVRNSHIDDEESDYVQNLRYYLDTIGTVEYCASDFVNTSMDAIGSRRKLYVADLAIRKDYRRLGLATSLLMEIEKRCFVENFEEIYLHVEVTNQAAQSLYKKLGFIELPSDNEDVLSFTKARLEQPANDVKMMYKPVNFAPIEAMVK